MATIISSYPPNLYHQQAYLNPTSTPFYGAQYIPSNYYKPKSQKPHKLQKQPQPHKQQLQQQQQQQQKEQQKTRTPTPTKTNEKVDSNLHQLRPRREPRIHRQVIVLPTPEPIYRQVRHRLPTPERQVIKRTVIQKANGEVIIRHQRHRKSVRSHSQPEDATEKRASHTRQTNAD